jgi:HNH endonuclease
MKENWPDWKIYVDGQCSCVYCGFSGAGKDSFNCWRQLAIDHLIPISKGGRDEKDNKVVACHRCNTMKGCFDPSDGMRPALISRAKCGMLSLRRSKNI